MDEHSFNPPGNQDGTNADVGTTTQPIMQSQGSAEPDVEVKEETSEHAIPQKLVGYITTRILDEIRKRDMAYSMMPEATQRDLINDLSSIARSLVARTLDLMVEQGPTAVPVTVGKFASNADTGFKFEVVASTFEHIEAVAAAKGMPARLLLGSVDQFDDKSRPEADKDEPELPMEEDASASEGEEGDQTSEENPEGEETSEGE